VNNVADALAAMEKEVFAVVVCDLMMPVQTGMDLYSKACASYPAMAGSFIFITGGAYTTEARAFLDQTTAPILEKPFRLNRMRDVVEDMILSEARGKASRVSRDGLIVLEHAEAEQQNQLSD
jgi:DNA-binding NtrC family response regulator